ncbi:unnamed protein product, partial [Brenthis ino]
MRARPPPPLLLATLAIVTTAAPLLLSDPTTAPLLLVVHSGCPTQDPSLYSKSRLEQYATATKQLSKLSRPYLLLSYEDTCGINWETSITRNALSALGAGGGVVSTGRPGSTVCNSVTAAAKALHRPQPLMCNEPHARSIVVVQLVKSLKWRSVLLLYTNNESECTVALLQAEHALTAAGILVRSMILPSAVTNFRPHVIVLCDLSIAATKIAINISSAPILLLQITGNKRFNMVHAEDISNLSTRRTNLQENLESTAKAVLSDFISDYFDIRNNFLKMTTLEDDEWIKLYSLNKNPQKKLKRHAIIVSDEVTNKDKINDNTRRKMKTYKNKANFRRRRDSEHNMADDQNEQNIGMTMIETAVMNRIIILSDNILDTKPTAQVVYDELLEATFLYLKAEHTRIELSRNIFFLFKSETKNETLKWKRIAIFKTTSTRSLDKSEEWATTVSLDTSGELELKVWGATHFSEDVDDFKAVFSMEMVQLAIVLLCVACVLCVALAVGAAFAKRAVNRHTPRRPRALPILASADFQFPADERRRVGEGMETMLSLLQQLHEFAGPEPERPDLLKQPEPLGQSAPSSTCSVTRLTPDNRTRYKGDPVHMKYLPAATLELRRKTIDILLVMQSLRHENLNPFIGCLTEIRPALVFEACGRGSLEDVLVADDIRLDWTFRLSLLTDLVRGMRYLHSSPVRVHARLSSRNCVVDSRWVLRITDYGLPAFASAQALPYPPRAARDLLWTAPEILRETSSSTVPGGTQPGDVFSFAIIMQEVIVRGEPYCMLSLTPEEILDKLSHPPPLIRPSVSMGAAPPEAVSVMRQCWSEQPDLRPDFNRLYEVFRHMHRGRKVNIVDSMFEMLEKYSNNLEELIKERTEQLDMEKKKTEQLLNRMLPRSVAERLMLGLRVEPEEFEEVSIYFSDIVGFTSLAARSTPVQVVDLLNDLYTTFDAAIEQYRVYKVETIGDAYMVVGGLPIRCSDHAENIATMALHLLHLAGRFRIRHLPATPLHLRIGLHTGACCAGVVGLTMPRYCLFGDTVNTASRMESTGAAWRIQVSAATAERLVAAGGYRLRSRGLTQIKGKGAMHTYWLLGKDGFDKSLPTPPPLESEEVLFETEAENDIEAAESLTVNDMHSVSAVQSVERQRSDPSPAVDKYAWQRSGAASAESSPPPPSLPRCRYLRSSVSTVASLLDTPRLSDRWSTTGGRTLRRQWSLERGDDLAAAAAELPATGAPPAALAGEPLALRAPPARAAMPRYRTRRNTSMQDVSDR